MALTFGSLPPAFGGSPQNSGSTPSSTVAPSSLPTGSVYNGISGALTPTQQPTYGNPAAPSATPVFYKPLPNNPLVVDRNGQGVTLQQYKQLTGQQNVADNAVNWSSVKNFAPPGYQAPAPAAPVSAPQSPSTYNSSNQPAVQTAPPTPLNVPTPDTTTPTTQMVNQDTTGSDIQKLLAQSLSRQDSLFAQLQQYSSVSPEEQAQQKKVAGDQAAMTGLGYQAQGLYNPDNQAIALPFLTGQAQSKMVGAGLQSNLDQSVLNYMQGNRQFAFNSAKDIFDASRNNLSSMVDIYSKTAPQNLSTNYNPTTGQVTAIMRNPLTGAQYTGDLGNIGAQKSFTSQQIVPDPVNPGHFYFFGTQSDGTIVQKEIGNGTSGVSGGTSASPGQVQGLGQVSIPGYSAAVDPSTNQPWRTDRNNNPIAAGMTTGSTGNEFTKALDQAGIPWTQGDAFGSNPKMSTIKIMGDPVEASRAILSNSGAIQNWYINHTGKSVLPQFGIKNNTDFAKASKDVQNAVIDGIYKSEAGSGILTHPQSSSPTDPTQLVQTFKAKYPTVSNGLNQAADGTPWIDLGQVPNSDDQRIASIYGPQYGLKALPAADAKTVKDVSTAVANMNTMYQQFKSLAATGWTGAIGQNVSGPLGKLFNTDTGNQLAAYQKNRDNLFQQINSLAGSNPRINSNELVAAANALPKLDEFNHDTLASGQAKLALTQQYLDNAMKVLLPTYKGDVLGLNQSSGPNATAILDNLIKQNGG